MIFSGKLLFLSYFGTDFEILPAKHFAMKKFVLTSLLASAPLLFAMNEPENYRIIRQEYFQRGEHLEYLVHLGPFNAGIGTIDMDNKLYSVNNRPCYKVDVYGRSIGTLEGVTKIRDFWRSYIDTASIHPHKFYRNINEGDYHKEETVWFNTLQKTAEIKDEKGQRKFGIPEYVQDLVSGFYFLRTLPFEKYKDGEILSIHGTLETDIYDLKVEFLGKQEAKCLLGKMDCYVLSPIMPENQLFRGKRPIKVFISADKNRIPIRIQADMLVGQVEAELQKHQNMRHPLVFRK